VGTAVRIEHRRATPVGAAVWVTAEPPATAPGPRLTSTAQVLDGSGKVLAAGETHRAIVIRQQFLEESAVASESQNVMSGLIM
jgi:predicted thioesterase